MKKKPTDLNADAREVLKKRVPVAKPAAPVVNPPPASVFSLLKSKLPAEAPTIPRGTPILGPGKKVKPAPKGGES